MRMTHHQATGFHSQGTGKRGHARQGKTGLDETFGMGNMKGASEGIEVTPHLVCGDELQDPLLIEPFFLFGRGDWGGG